MFEKKKNYVLGFVFDYELKEVLLIKRLNEPYCGKLNGMILLTINSMTLETRI